MTRFIRMWEYYLAVCEAGFLTRNTSDLQIVFSKLPVRAELPRGGCSRRMGWRRWRRRGGLLRRKVEQ